MPHAPFKLTLAALFLDGTPRSAAEAFTEFAPLYARHSFFNAKFLATSIQSLQSVGILKIVHGTEEEASAPRYTLTGHGRGKVERNI